MSSFCFYVLSAYPSFVPPIDWGEVLRGPVALIAHHTSLSLRRLLSGRDLFARRERQAA
jgi:hypothetical protein